MRGCFQNIEQAVDYIKYIALDNFNVSVKLYRGGGCWYVDEETAAPPKPNNLTVEQAFAIFMEKYSEAMKELSEK